MPLYTTSIRLFSATEADYDRLSQELKKKSFRTSLTRKAENGQASDSEMVFATNQSTMLEVTSTVSAAAFRTGRKFTFSVVKEKTT